MGLFLLGKFFICCGALGLGLSCLGLEPALGGGRGGRGGHLPPLTPKICMYI